MTVMDPKVLTNTIQYIPDPEQANYGSLLMLFASTAAEIEPWGRQWAKRDRQLEKFALSEPYLKSTIYSISAGRAALTWELDGPPRTVKRVQEMLNGADLGNGWISLMSKVSTSLLMYDNGAFIEIIRAKPTGGRKPEQMPVLGLNHLSSHRCIRTGNPAVPVIYLDENGKYYKMPWYNVMVLEEFPHPVDIYYNRQISFVSRILEGARIIQAISTYKKEKITGRNSKAMHLVGGVSRAEIENAQRYANIAADNAGLTTYMDPVILTALDPTARVTHVELELASLPDHFDEDVTMKWYITLLALASGGDFQDLAPLPGGNLGTASQSETLHRKSRVRGTQLWMKLIEHKLKYHRVLPANVTFMYTEEDAQAEADRTTIRQQRAQLRSTMISSGEITPEVSRRMAVDDGDLKPEHLLMMEETEEDTPVTVGDVDDVSQTMLEGEEPEELPVTVNDTDSKATYVHASKMATAFTDLVYHSPMQAYAPIPPAKLDNFRVELTNRLVGKGAVYTTLSWLSNELIEAATESGIHVMSLKQRLPDGYGIRVAGDRLIDSTGRVLYKPPLVVEPKYHCHKCATETKQFTFIPTIGIVPTCTTHKGILDFDGTLDGLVGSFVELYKPIDRDILLHTIVAAFTLGGGTFKEEKHGKQVNYELAKLVVVGKNTDALVTAIHKWYLKGVKTTWI